MSSQVKIPGRYDDGARYAALSRRFQPVFDRIAGGAVARETGRILLQEPIAWLKEAGFTRIHVPEAYGGDGASITVQARLLIDLAAAEPSIPLALRSHVSMVEDALNCPDAVAAPWFRRFAAGETFGSAWTEPRNRQGEVRTTVIPDGAGGLAAHGREILFDRCDFCRPDRSLRPGQ
nr:acyl-CoA dehydrogenase family protein [Paracoccus sp. IB05]